MNITTARGLWLGELSTNGASDWTIRNYRRATDAAFESMAQRRGLVCGTIDLDTVERDDMVGALADYVEWTDSVTDVVRKRAQTSMASYATALRSFFSWCVESEKLDRSPMARVKRPKAPVRVPKAMDANQCRQLIDAAGKSRSAERDTLLVLVGLTMGLRLAELANVKAGDFHPNVVTPTHLRLIGKGNKERLVPVPHVVREALEAWLPVRKAQLERAGATAETLFVSQRAHGRAMDASRGTVAQVYSRLLEVAGLKKKGRRVHVARHSFATLVLEAGADISTVAELLGHASVATTQIYLKANPERMMSAVEANPLAKTPEVPLAS